MHIVQQSQAMVLVQLAAVLSVFAQQAELYVSSLSGVKQWVCTLIIELQQVNKMKRLLPCIVCDTHSTERAQFVLLVTHNISKHRAIQSIGLEQHAV